MATRAGPMGPPEGIAADDKNPAKRLFEVPQSGIVIVFRSGRYSPGGLYDGWVKIEAII